MSEEKSVREFQKKPFAAFESMKRKHPATSTLTDADLGVLLGYSKTVIHTWRREETVPAVALLALEGLIRREVNKGGVIAVVKCDTKDDFFWLKGSVERTNGVDLLGSHDC